MDSGRIGKTRGRPPHARPLEHNIPLRLKLERETLGMSQEELGKLLGRSTSAVSRMESGEMAIPADLMPLWAAILGVEVWRLYEKPPSFAQKIFTAAS
jgi:transcriptional regulator with XRE-family HTH domain